MALFKISRGLKANLPKTATEGYCYVTTDDGKFYIDIDNNISHRLVLNAGKADSATTATTAGSFTEDKSIALTGDVTGSKSSKGGWSIATTLANSGVTASTYGPTANATPAHSGTFTVPEFTVDSKGRITGAWNRTITLPASGNTWRDVQNNLTSTAVDQSLSAAQGKVLNEKFGSMQGYSWNAKAKGKTWSRLAYIAAGTNVSGSAFMLHVSHTRDSVVYNNTFMINAHYSSKARITCISGGQYSTIKLRAVSDSNGNCYVELWDEANSATTSTDITSIHCRLIGIYTGTVTTYTAFTTGATLPSGYTASAEITTDTGCGFVGNLKGNATTATAFSAAKSVALSGDVSGSASSTGGWSIATTLANSGVTAGSYGPSANASPAYGATFSVPQITVDAKGRVTSASTRTVKIPASDNTWRNVVDTLTSTSTSDSLSAAKGKALNDTLQGAIKGLSVSGRTITYTKVDGSTGSITTQDNNTTYTANNGVSLSGTTFSNSGVRSVATGTSNGTIAVNTNGTTANVAVKGLGTAAYTASTSYAANGTIVGDLNGYTTPGIYNASGSNTYANVPGDLKTLNGDTNFGLIVIHVAAGAYYVQLLYDSSGHSWRRTGMPSRWNDWVRQEYSAGTGISISNQTITNTGVRSIATGSSNGTISVNTNGTTANVAVKGLGTAAYTASTAYATAGHTHSYAGSSSAGGAATSANKLNTNAGAADNPVYFNNGIPVAITSYKGKAATAGTADKLGTNAGSASSPVYFTNGVPAAVTSIPASLLTGTIDMARMPQGALERMKVVADDTARYKLTTSDVQVGDVVKVTGTSQMYYVKDTANLANANGYEVFAVGSAASVPWSGVTGKPNYAGSSSQGGSATSAVKLDTATAGSASTPVYFSNGVPVAVGMRSTANALMNALETATSTPTADDYYIAQYAGGGTTNTTYHRRPISALANYMKTVMLPLAGGKITGDLSAKTFVTYLDGVTGDKTGLGNSYIKLIPNVAYSRIDSTHRDETYFKALIKLLCELYPSDSGIIYIGTATPNSSSITAIRIYQNNVVDSTTKLPQYSSGIEITLSGSVYTFGTHAYTWYWQDKQIAESTTGNAATATAFSAAKAVTLTGDITGTASSTGGWSVATTLANSGVSAGSYGPSANASPAHSGTFTVPYITVDAKGRVTAASTKTITLPADNNTTYTTFVKSGTGAAAGLVPAPSTTAGTTKYLREDGTWTVPPDTNTTYTSLKNPYALTIQFNGTSQTAYDGSATRTYNITPSAIGAAASSHTHNYAESSSAGGAATSANKLNTNAGTATQPVYFSNGVPVATTYTLAKSVPANADFNNTWRPIVNNLTSTATDSSLSAAQGKALNDKFANYLPLTGGDLTGALTATSFGTNASFTIVPQGGNEINFGGTGTSNTICFGYTAVGDRATPTTYMFGGGGATATISAGRVYGAVWNDYAEYRETVGIIEPGRVVIETGTDKLVRSNYRLEGGANIVSDTFGFAIGETTECKTPLAMAGRVLAYPYESREEFAPGDAVCSGPNGTVSKMTREEIMMYPDRIIGTVSCVPEYETWGPKEIKVNGRIWIKVK